MNKVKTRFLHVEKNAVGEELDLAMFNIHVDFRLNTVMDTSRTNSIYLVLENNILVKKTGGECGNMCPTWVCNILTNFI